jgi:hypothetical protein
MGSNGLGKKKWWPGAELNCRHCDFQSHALPTELPGRGRADYRELSGVCKKPGRRLFFAFARAGAERCLCPNGGDFDIFEHIRRLRKKESSRIVAGCVQSTKYAGLKYRGRAANVARSLQEPLSTG